MDIISDLNSEIALAVLLEGRNRQKLDVREAIEIVCRVSSALEPFTQSNNNAGRADAGTSENNTATGQSAL
jgi:hypothetical protein